MKPSDFMNECTTAGAVAPVAQPLGKTISRSGKKGGNLFKGKKTNKPFYEDAINEEDKIVSPDKGSKTKTGLHGKDKNTTELSKFLPPFKAQGLWVSDRRGNNVLEVTKHGTLAAEIANALNSQHITHECFTPGGVIAGGGVGESEELHELRSNDIRGILKRALQKEKEQIANRDMVGAARTGKQIAAIYSRLQQREKKQSNEPKQSELFAEGTGTEIAEASYNHLVAKFMKDGKAYHLWNDGNYLYNLTRVIDGVPKHVHHWPQADLEQVEAELLKRGYTKQSHKGLAPDITKQGVEEGLNWSSLDEGLSLDDKMSIFEEFYTTGNLTEAIDDDKRKYFESLVSMSDTPTKNKRYIVAPLSLVGNRILPLDQPSYSLFLGKTPDKQLAFRLAGEVVKYPSTTMRDLSVFNTFIFSSTDVYNKFRVALSLKFDINLPEIDIEKMQDVEEGFTTPGISAEDLANSIFYRLERMYPDIVTRHGHEVVGDAIMDVADFHAGAEEVGSSDISGMVREVLRILDRSQNKDDIEEDCIEEFTKVKQGVAEAGVQSPHAKLAQLKARYEKTLSSGKFNPDTLRKLRDQIIKLEFDLGLKEGVAEAFDAPYKVKWVQNKGEAHYVDVTLPDGSLLDIRFFRDDGVTPNPDEWTVEFYRDDTQEITGTGDAQRIFATVIKAIEKFIKIEKPKEIAFAASKTTQAGSSNQSRTNLYNRLIQRYAPSWGYDVVVKNLKGTTGYKLFRRGKKKGVAEGSPQSMDTALANAVSKVEPGSKLDKKIRHHNDMVRRFGPEAGTMTSAPDGYHIDKKGFVRLGQGVAEGFGKSSLKAQTPGGRSVDINPSKFYVWAWDGGVVVYGEYDTGQEAKAKLSIIELRAIQRLGSAVKGRFEVASGKQLIHHYSIDENASEVHVKGKSNMSSNILKGISEAPMKPVRTYQAGGPDDPAVKAKLRAKEKYAKGKEGRLAELRMEPIVVAGGDVFSERPEVDANTLEKLADDSGVGMSGRVEDYNVVKRGSIEKDGVRVAAVKLNIFVDIDLTDMYDQQTIDTMYGGETHTMESFNATVYRDPKNPKQLRMSF